MTRPKVADDTVGVCFEPFQYTLLRALAESVPAETVETAEQRELLLRDGCDEMQGFWFSWPINASKLGALLQDNMNS